MSDKSILVFTNFWDANYVIDSRFLLLHDKKNQKLLRINLLKDKNGEAANFSTNSIALSHPDRSNKLNIPMDRIDCLCPTYDMLTKYKKDKDWDAYQKHFIELIKKRKVVIRDWVNSLKTDWVYFLCCWENTSHGAHCHREILYKAFSESATISKKIISIYRSGEKIYKKESSAHDYPMEMVQLPRNWGRVTYQQGFNLVPITTSTSNSDAYQYVTMDSRTSRVNPDRTVSLVDEFIPRPANVNDLRRAQEDINPDDPPDDPPF